ncbi:MAG: ABC transporter permease [Eubacteriales bacterium]|nr:ABC transporter permease [Eubacteriales bacterium]
MIENIRLSFQGVWSHKMRSFLTMLGIIIGIASIISIVSTIQGTNEQIRENLIGAGNNAVTVQLSRGDSTYEFYDYDTVPDGLPVITEEIRQQILVVDGVEDASLYNSRSWADGIYYQNTALSTAQVYGIDMHYFNTCGYVVRTGREFIQSDYDEFRKVAILDQTAASSLFQEDDPLGKTIEIGQQPYVVVGVAQKRAGFEPVINSEEEYDLYMGNEDSGVVYIPSAAWGIAYRYDEPQNLVVKAASIDDMTSAGKKCADILNQYVTTSEDIKYKAADLLETAQQIQSSSAAMNNQLIWIASISLLVGGIGVMNIMLVSVTERISEIGLKKAIGAKKRSILGQFLTEAVVLTSTGGIIGVFTGIVMAQVISKMSDTRVGISVPAIVISVAFSMLIGIVFGLIPSIKAANLNPIDALRHE